MCWARTSQALSGRGPDLKGNRKPSGRQTDRGRENQRQLRGEGSQSLRFKSCLAPPSNETLDDMLAFSEPLSSGYNRSLSERTGKCLVAHKVLGGGEQPLSQAVLPHTENLVCGRSREWACCNSP